MPQTAEALAHYFEYTNPFTLKKSWYFEYTNPLTSKQISFSMSGPAGNLRRKRRRNESEGEPSPGPTGKIWPNPGYEASTPENQWRNDMENDGEALAPVNKAGNSGYVAETFKDYKIYDAHVEALEYDTATKKHTNMFPHHVKLGDRNMVLLLNEVQQKRMTKLSMYSNWPADAGKFGVLSQKQQC